MSENEIVLDDISGKYLRIAIKPDQLPPEYVKIRDFHRNHDDEKWAENKDSPIYVMLSDCEKIAQEWGRDEKWEKLKEFIEEYIHDQKKDERKGMKKQSRSTCEWARGRINASEIILKKIKKLEEG